VRKCLPSDVGGKLDLDVFLSKLKATGLPPYARPVFLRVTARSDVFDFTSTHKIKRTKMQTDGYDLSKLPPGDKASLSPLSHLTECVSIRCFICPKAHRSTFPWRAIRPLAISASEDWPPSCRREKPLASKAIKEKGRGECSKEKTT